MSQVHDTQNVVNICAGSKKVSKILDYYYNASELAI